MKQEKTNVCRVLDAARISYELFSFETETAVSGVEAAAILNMDAGCMYKTLVTTGKSGSHYVFDIPVAEELDLKKAAAAVGEKNIEMLKSKDLLGLTGYVHGGCSPIGMKKVFTTVFHETARTQNHIVFSAGKIGYQVKLNPSDLEKVIRFTYSDLIIS